MSLQQKTVADLSTGDVVTSKDLGIAGRPVRVNHTRQGNVELWVQGESQPRKAITKTEAGTAKVWVAAR